MNDIKNRFKKIIDISDFFVNSYIDDNRTYVGVTITGRNNDMSVRTILKIGELFYKYGKTFNMSAIISIMKSATILIETNVNENNIISNPIEMNVFVLGKVLDELEHGFW